MAQRGRFYPYVARRDLNVLLPRFSQQWPNRWVWTQDNLTLSNDPGSNRMGKASAAAAYPHDGRSITWRWTLAPFLGATGFLDLRFELTNKEGDFRFLFTASDNAGRGTTTWELDERSVRLATIIAIDGFPTFPPPTLTNTGTYTSFWNLGIQIFHLNVADYSVP